MNKLVRKGAQKRRRSPHQIYALSLFRFRIACAHLRLRTPTPTHASAYARLRLRTLRPTDPLPRGRVPRPGPSARDSRLARSDGVYLPPKFWTFEISNKNIWFFEKMKTKLKKLLKKLESFWNYFWTHFDLKKSRKKGKKGNYFWFFFEKIIENKIWKIWNPLKCPKMQ